MSLKNASLKPAKPAKAPADVTSIDYTPTDYLAMDVIKKGWMTKLRKGLMMSWQARFFVILPSELFWVNEPKGSGPVKVTNRLSFDHVTGITTQESKDVLHLIIAVDRPEEGAKQYTLCHESVDTLYEWEAALSAAVNTHREMSGGQGGRTANPLLAPPAPGRDWVADKWPLPPMEGEGERPSRHPCYDECLSTSDMDLGGVNLVTPSATETPYLSRNDCGKCLDYSNSQYMHRGDAKAAPSPTPPLVVYACADSIGNRANPFWERRTEAVVAVAEAYTVWRDVCTFYTWITSAPTNANSPVHEEHDQALPCAGSGYLATSNTLLCSKHRAITMDAFILPLAKRCNINVVEVFTPLAGIVWDDANRRIVCEKGKERFAEDAARIAGATWCVGNTDLVVGDTILREVMSEVGEEVVLPETEEGVTYISMPRTRSILNMGLADFVLPLPWANM
ncbi:hypothetical protein KIPB_000595 [Kipferlia bialata]|uniref:PH domain-containing protein n=1 Tax=Kipferlia bialata TaxID=797122 RepID=A0A9K3GET0_9EUKA|nr:hypothetical protein KIPB_000595 [Kipferlia bialata]|eukprot:g595.t1